MALEDRVRCQLCGRWLQSLVRHILCKHRVPIDEYKRRYGVRKVMSPRLRLRMSLDWVRRRKMGRYVWTDERVVRAIRRLGRRRDSLRYGTVRAQHPEMLDAARAHFGTWAAAVRAAGHDYEAVKLLRGERSWSRETVVREIGARRKGRRALSDRAVRQEDPRLAAAARQHFGGWKRAIEAAGIDYGAIRLRPPGRHWTREEVLDLLRRRLAAGRSLVPSEVERQAPAVARGVARVFGSWRKALGAIGLDYRAVLLPLRNRWTGERVVAAVREEHAAGRSMRPSDVKRRCPSLHNAVNHFFRGGWRAALAAAGLDPEAYLPRAWTRKRIIDGIRARVRDGRPLTTKLAMADDHPLVSAAVKRLGSWRAALRAAGFVYPARVPDPSRWTRERVVEAIRREAAAGRSMDPGAVDRRDHSLRLAATRCVGGWRAALEAAGVDPERVMKRRWTRERVAGAIRDRARRGRPLGYTAAQTDDPGMVTTAARLYGSWRAAVTAAGFEYRGHPGASKGAWSRERVVAAILAERKAGRSLRPQDVQRRNRQLNVAAYRLFPGGWRAALAEAGIDPETVLGRRGAKGLADRGGAGGK